MAEINSDMNSRNTRKIQEIQTKEDKNDNNNNNNNRRRNEVDTDFWSSVVTDKDTTMDETYEMQTENERQQQQQERTDNTMMYSNMTQKNDIFRGKLTLTADIQGIPNFTFERLCHDLSTRQPRAWKRVLGVQPIQRRTLEIQFDNEQALTHIQIHGLDTHNVHLTFIPDQPLVTTVSFWNILLGMEPQQVDEHIQRFGEIKSNYKSKKNISRRTIYTGVRVYNIILKKAIPRFLQIGGKQIRTKYTGQEQHLQQERDARQIEREKREVQRQQQQYDRENQDNDTDANVTTLPNVNKPETTTETITDTTITVTEEKPEDIRPTLTDELLIHVLQTNADPLRIHNKTEEDTDAADFTVVKGKTKRKKTTKDSDD